MRLQRDSYAPKSCAFDAANVQFLRAHLCKSHPVLQHVKFFALIDDEHTRLFVGGGSGRQNAALPPRGRPKRDSAAKSSARSRVLPAPCRPVTASICDVARRAAGLKPPAQAQQLLFAPEKRHQVLPLMYFVFKKYDFLGTVILGC